VETKKTQGVISGKNYMISTIRMW